MSSSDHVLNLGSSLFLYRETGFLCDTVILAADQQTVYAHSVVLATVSSKLREKFENLDVANVQHNYLFVVRMDDCSQSAIEMLLQYIYTGSVLLQEISLDSIKTGQKLGLDKNKVDELLRVSGLEAQTGVPFSPEHEVHVEIIKRDAEVKEDQGRHSGVDHEFQSNAVFPAESFTSSEQMSLQGASSTEGPDTKKRKTSDSVTRNWESDSTEKDVFNLLSDAEALLKLCSGKSDMWNMLGMSIGKGLLIYTNPDEDGSCLSEMLESFQFYIKDAKGMTSVQKLEDFLNYGLSKKCAGFVIKEIEVAADDVRKSLTTAVQNIFITGFPGFIIVTSRNLHSLDKEFRKHFSVHYGWV